MLIRMSAEPIELTPGKEFSLGRSSDCDLTIHSKNVSRNHAKITWNDEGDAVSLQITATDPDEEPRFLWVSGLFSRCRRSNPVRVWGRCGASSRAAPIW